MSPDKVKLAQSGSHIDASSKLSYYMVQQTYPLLRNQFSINNSG